MAVAPAVVAPEVGECRVEGCGGGSAGGGGWWGEGGVEGDGGAVF